MVLAGAAGLTAAYFLGFWIPNFPDPIRYPVHGIDVSHHQGEIDWKSVAASGIQFAYLKASEGQTFQDPGFQRNLLGATRAGVHCGAYHYFILGAPGAGQAQNFIRSVPAGSTDLPPAIDLETSGNSSARPSVSEFQGQLDIMMQDLRTAYGTEPVIYSSSDFIRTYLDGYPPQRLWYRAVVWNPYLFGFEQWTFWQFTERAKVAGIRGFVDMDVYRGDSRDFQSWLHH